MSKQYTLDEIKDIVSNGIVTTTNLTDIISSLKDYDYNSEIRKIFINLSNNKGLPETVRVNFRNFVDSYDELYKPKEEQVVVMKEPIKEEAKVTEEVVFEQPVITTINNEPVVEEPKKKEDAISLENDAVMGGLIAYAATKGLKVISNNPGINGTPEISLELTYESKPYIDNLLLSLYDNKEDMNVEMKRIPTSGKEVLSLSVDNPNLTSQELQEQGKKMFTSITEVIKDTDKEKDYEKQMPPELKSLKDKFVNDDPNIPNKDFKVGFNYTNGIKNFYLVADSKEEAIEISELMGYDVKKDRGGNVFEIDTGDKNMTNTKLDKVTEDINSIDEVKDTEVGISDVDINYNNKHYNNENEATVIDFIEESKDPDNMSVVQIDVPTSSPNQRVVNLASEDGTRKTVVFNNGKDFDDYTLPKVAESFAKDSGVNRENTNKVNEGNNKSSYDALSNDNTYLRMNNFDDSTVDKVDDYLQNYMVDEKENENDNSMGKAPQKTLGPGPYGEPRPTNNNKESAKVSASAIILFTAIVIVGILLVAVVYGVI